MKQIPIIWAFVCREDDELKLNLNFKKLCLASVSKGLHLKDTQFYHAYRFCN